MMRVTQASGLLRGWRRMRHLPTSLRGEFYKLSDRERHDVVRIAVDQASGRIPVIGQANHPSSKVALDLAHRMETSGVSMISMAAPRIFALSEDDLLRYFRSVCQSISAPLLIQDFNPGVRRLEPTLRRGYMPTAQISAISN